MQNTITDKGKQLQESFPPIRTFKSTKRFVFHFMLLTVRFSLCSLFGIRGSSFQDLRFEKQYTARDLIWALFNKTFTNVIYKCSYCFQTPKQRLHLENTSVKVY